jgi:uncharacterized protein YndB with AHSA1/START domain
MEDGISGAHAEVELIVELARERLWDLVTDVARIGEWSPECRYAAWLDTDAPGPRPGARFEARNRYPNGDTASVICVVTEARRPETFAWVVLDERGDPDRPGSRWRYDLLPGDAPGRTVVRHSFTHGPGVTGARRAAERYPDALAGRLAQLRRNMTATITAMTRCDNPIEEEA